MLVSDSFVIADWTDPGVHPDRPIAPRYLHRSDDEAWIVLGGRLGFRVGEAERRELDAGDSLLVPIGTPHSYWNLAPEPGSLPTRDDSEDPQADRSAAQRRSC